MVASARTFSLHETLLEPQALKPPPTRHALFVCLLALAVLLHVVPAGWGDLYGETEGQYAGAAREMVQTHTWLEPTNDVRDCKAAVALLVAHCLVQAFWREYSGSAFANCDRDGCFGGADFLDRRTIDGLLARIHCWSDLSLQLGNISARAHDHAGARFRRVHDRRDLLRALWLSKTSGTKPLVSWRVGLCRARLPNERNSRPDLSSRNFSFCSQSFYREARIRFRGLLRWYFVLAFLLILLPWYVWAERNFPEFATASFSKRVA